MRMITDVVVRRPRLWRLDPAGRRQELRPARAGVGCVTRRRDEAAPDRRRARRRAGSARARARSGHGQRRRRAPRRGALARRGGDRRRRVAADDRGGAPPRDVRARAVRGRRRIGAAVRRRSVRARRTEQHDPVLRRARPRRRARRARRDRVQHGRSHADLRAAAACPSRARAARPRRCSSSRRPGPACRCLPSARKRRRVAGQGRSRRGHSGPDVSFRAATLTPHTRAR